MNTVRSTETDKNSVRPSVYFVMAALALWAAKGGVSNTGQTGAERKDTNPAIESTDGLSYDLQPQTVGAYQNALDRSARISKLEHEAEAALQRGDIKACEDAVYNLRQIRVKDGDPDFTFCYTGEEAVEPAPSPTSTTTPS